MAESEIAGDYPLPTQYDKEAEEEETDELLLFDEAYLNADPEFLPRRLIKDFSIYNSEVGKENAAISRTSSMLLA